jgi:hypothetical protein
MRHVLRSMLVALLVALLAAPAFAQAPTVVAATTPSNIVLIPISATTAVGNATTLTIPAPPGGQYNYVCFLAYEIGQDATDTALTLATSSSTNFNSFAVKVSQAATVNIDTGSLVAINSGGPGAGCVKSVAPGVATTFVQSASNAHATWTWYATYYQAP